MAKKCLIIGLKFILSICLILIVSLILVKNTLLDKNYVKGLLEKENYYEKLAVTTKEEMKNYLIQSGFTDEILDNIYTKDDVYNDVNTLIDQVYDNKEMHLDTDKLKENLNNAITDYLEDKNIQFSNNDDLVRFIDMISDIYTEEVGVVSYLNPIQKIIVTVSNYVMPVIIALSIISIILVLALWKLKSKNIFAISLFSLALLYLIVIFYLKSRIDIDNLLILGKDISSVIRYGYSDILNMVFKISIVSFVLGIVSSIWSVIREKNS